MIKIFNVFGKLAWSGIINADYVFISRSGRVIKVLEKWGRFNFLAVLKEAFNCIKFMQQRQVFLFNCREMDAKLVLIII